MLAPLPFIIFSAAAVEVINVRFSEDEVILKDLVYLQEAMAGSVKNTPVERVRRAD